MAKRVVSGPRVSWDTLFDLLYLLHAWGHSVVYTLSGDSVHYDLSARMLLTKHI